MAIERSDVCLIMIDAQDGVTEQDTKVAGLAHEAGKACIIVVNKWDLVEKDDKTMDRMREDIRRDLSYMTYAPIVFISALTGQRVDPSLRAHQLCPGAVLHADHHRDAQLRSGGCTDPCPAPHG